MNYEFPIYRKLSNGKVYYKINSLREFEEKQKIGVRVYLYVIKAEQYPEMLKIQDMLLCFEGIYLESTDVDWDHFI
ncbi:MAG: hypothetical protein HYR91_02230 [Flavobacteriia bacterium]|nr:hypothetical protein [Flavobacteriia bacterium]